MCGLVFVVLNNSEPSLIASSAPVFPLHCDLRTTECELTLIECNNNKQYNNSVLKLENKAFGD